LAFFDSSVIELSVLAVHPSTERKSARGYAKRLGEPRITRIWRTKL